ncbi:MAG: hypothetical protein MJZ83_03600 [Bacteroidaceae bacterium]|nr:hypothetical protein [Bacteroidaceae bacterium]
MTVEEVIELNIRAQFEIAVGQKQLFYQSRNQVILGKIAEAQDWTFQKRLSHWASLLESLREEFEAYGLDVNFYSNKFSSNPDNLKDIYWDKFLIDWEKANAEKLQDDLSRDIQTQEEGIEALIARTQVSVPKYLEEHKVSENEFVQIWGTMCGRWNAVDFERIRSVVRIQEKYPILLEVAKKMGRIADEESILRFSVASGNTQQVEHSTKSDIKGITVGDNLNQLLPLELTQASDEEMEDLFLYKYATKNLQNFSHRSEVLKPTRSLHIKPARQKGPMILCLDTSGSMVGQPELIGHSMMVKLLEIADAQNRPLYMIAFSVSVNPIDLRKERARMQQFFLKTSVGDTDATKMMEKTFSLLDGNPEYRSADVLWITDFKMPLVRKDLLDNMLNHRYDGTCFYGLRTGLAAEPVWEPYFDKIYDVAIPHFRKYGK